MKKKIRYAVVGLGYISQSAVLPAFEHATKNSELTALVSGDVTKLKKLSKTYGVKPEHLYSYDQYEDCLNSGAIDAVYIALPNSMHREYAVKAAKAGIHILCEKPMAMTAGECRDMIDAAKKARVKMMIAYRLHFEKANLKAIEIAKSGKLGDIRFFHSLFSMQVKDGNSRLQSQLGGGTLYDIGIYCINAARNLFQAEPEQVFAFSVGGEQKRFKEVEEMVSALLYFPDGRIASFTSSFGAADVSIFEIVGTKGSLRVDPAYEIAEPLKHVVKKAGKEKKETFGKRDQFAPELLYFSNCILTGKNPEPSGVEGLADVRIISALYESAHLGEKITLEKFEKRARPTMEQEIQCRPVSKHPLIHAQSPSKEVS